MTFRSKGKDKKKASKLWLIVPALMLIAGIYLLINLLTPALPPPAVTLSSQPELVENRLYIPKIGVDVLVVEGGAEVLEKGAWHRYPENGSPEKGGNFVLSAHRFQLGFTPQQTRAKSPFFHIDKLQIGEKIYVDYNGSRYTYEVTRKYKVPRTAVEIEAPSVAAKMTLYSCDLRGEAAGREVIEAEPI